MSPPKISLFILFSLGILLSITLLSRRTAIPEGKTENGIQLGKVLIKYPTTGHFLGDEKYIPNKKADTIITLIRQNLPQHDLPRSVPDLSSIDTSEIVRIDYPDNRNAFISGLSSKLSGGSCRILHYGDSQLEGDRISGYLRNRLQGIYGGSGPGFIPVKQVYEQIAADVQVSDNWLRFAAFDPNSESLPDHNWGLFASVSRFTPLPTADNDTTKQASLLPVKANINIQPPAHSYFRLKHYRSVGIHYGNARFPVSVSIVANGLKTGSYQLINDGAYHCFEIDPGDPPAMLNIEFESVESPDFYGITLDGNNGIHLDNIAMRGASGTVFTRINPAAFSSMATRLQPEIVLFQYGGNTVPYTSDSVKTDNYVAYLVQQIKWIQRQIPGVLFICIGPGDMSTSVDGQMVTYPLLPYLDGQLRRTCRANGIAYWSMYKAMGGENSMPQWVDEHLAGSDYTHFSPAGTRVISELFFTSLYLDLH